MKKILSIVLFLVVTIAAAFAQPQKMSYQTVVRNANNELVVNQPVGLQVYIFEDNANGPLVYSETHTASTNANGLVSIVIGTGFHTYTTSLSDVQWAAHDHYLRVDIDPAGGINYSITGTQQLMTVPYAFYSESARYVDTAKYAATALHADTAYFLANFQNSDTSLFSFNSDTAAFASNANNAVNATYATSAGTAATATSATYADSANVANYAYNANNAVNAQHSDTALYAYDANNAATANYATSAGAAATATYADSTRISNHANFSNTAIYADTSRISNISNYADSSDFNHLANRPMGTNMGDILYWDTITTSWHILPRGNSGEVLTMDTNNVPYWNTGGGGSVIALPTVQTDSVMNITGGSAEATGTVTNGGGTPMVFSGICWSTLHNPTIADNHTLDGIGINTFSSPMQNLAPNTTYYVRAYATNSAGTAYGAELSFKTLVILPTVVTDIVTPNNATTATSGGNVTSDGGDSVTARGVCWNTSGNPTTANTHTTDGAGMGTFVSTLTGLSSLTTYYVRAYATNSLGTAYGTVVVLTMPTIPTVDITTVSNVTDSSATSGGNVTYDGGAAVTARGVVWSTNSNPDLNNGSYTVDSSGLGSYTSYLTGLAPLTYYYIRAYATNIAGTGYSYFDSWDCEWQGGCFMTPPAYHNTQSCPGAATVSDIDNNVYNTIQIGNQCWMKENLRTTRFPNGTSITEGFSGNYSSYSPYYYHVQDNSSYDSYYGLLYNWQAVMNGAGASALNPSGVQGICPNGWHVPSGLEWTELVNYVSSQSMYQCSGQYSAKSLAATTDWQNWGGCDGCSPSNTMSANNGTGFTALPASYHYGDWYGYPGENACFYTTTMYNSNYQYPMGYTLETCSSSPYINSYDQYNGLSVRCVKDGGGVTYVDGQPCTGTPTVTDNDGNTYNTIYIGGQCWMRENLRTTKYPDGTSILYGPNQSPTTSSTVGYYYHANNNASNDVAYGLLYNWTAAMDSAATSSTIPSGVQGICPSGWHIPSYGEYNLLMNYVKSGQYVCNNYTYYNAKPLASASHWNTSTNTCVVGNGLSSNNATGFSMEPAGWMSGSYNYLDQRSYIWTATMNGTTNAYYLYSYYTSTSVSQSTLNKYYGLSVRCVKD